MAQADRHHITAAASRGQFAEAILRDILNSADMLGDSPTGGAFLLVEVDRDLLRELSAFGATAEDDEDDDPAGGNVEDEGETTHEDMPRGGGVVSRIASASMPYRAGGFLGPLRLFREPDRLTTDRSSGRIAGMEVRPC